MNINSNTLQIIRVFSLVLVLSAVSSLYAMAQSKIPEGSYKKTCKNMHVVGDFLIANCENEKGEWINTKINMDYCVRDIRNENGVLKCKQKPAPKPPAGSYTNSCRDIKVQGKQLKAICKNRNGKWKSTSINFKKCDKKISNDNGQLVCGKAGGGGKLPPGSYKDSCKNIYKEGNILEADCKNRNGKWKHSSIRFKECKRGLWNDNGKLRCN